MAPKINKSLANALRGLEQEEAKSQKRISDARAKRFALNINSCLALRPELAPSVFDHLSTLGVDWKNIEAHQQLSLRGTSVAKVEDLTECTAASGSDVSDHQASDKLARGILPECYTAAFIYLLNRYACSMLIAFALSLCASQWLGPLHIHDGPREGIAAWIHCFLMYLLPDGRKGY